MLTKNEEKTRRIVEKGVELFPRNRPLQKLRKKLTGH